MAAATGLARRHRDLADPERFDARRHLITYRARRRSHLVDWSMELERLYDAVRGWDSKTWLMAFALFSAVLLGLATAKALARRQELGKRQQQDLLEIRDVVRSALHQVRAAVAYASSSGRLQADDLEQRLGDFAATICEKAASLPERQKRRIRRLLVILVGEDGVYMAEELGTAYQQTEPQHVCSHINVASARESWCEDFRARPGVDTNCGLLCLYHEDSRDDPLARLQRATPVLEQLLKRVGGRTRLARRTSWEIYRAVRARWELRTAEKKVQSVNDVDQAA